MNQNIRNVELPAGLETEKFLIGSGAIAEIPAVLNELFPGKTPWIITDENIWSTAGGRISSLLQDSGLNPAKPYIFSSDDLHAHYTHVQELADAMPENAVPVAVAAGTINDFTKRLACEKNCRYLCVPTACSVDGYTSYGAALIKDGFKQTLPCPAPLAIIADTDVLYTAPRSMYASGYADLAAKVPAGADWIIAEELGIEPIRKDIWDLVQPTLVERLTHPEDMEGIFFGLAATGYAMQWYRESRPASGAEHLFAHVLEMDGVDASHGFKVALGTLASTAMYEWLFAHSADEIRALATLPLPADARREEINMLLSSGHYGSNAEKIAMDKYLEGNAAVARRELILKHWDSMQRRTIAQLIPYTSLLSMFEFVGAPTKLADLHLKRNYAKHALLTSQLIRNRYTIVDLLMDLGLLHAAADFATAKLAGTDAAR